MGVTMNWLRRIIDTSWGAIGLGFVLVFTGWLIPMLTVLHLIPSSFLLLFPAYAMSTVGLMLGIIGAARIVVKNRNSAEKEAGRKRYPWEQ